MEPRLNRGGHSVNSRDVCPLIDSNAAAPRRQITGRCRSVAAKR